MNTDLDYLDHLARESARFLQALREAAPDAPVPSCPDWRAEDLLRHLGEVQWFWGAIVRDGVTDSSKAEKLEQERPADGADVVAFYERASRDLYEILAATPPKTPAWTWSEEQTVAFIRRRQAQEALMHRVDAELTAEARSPMDPQLSADGVDEALRIMYGGVPPWGMFATDNTKTVRLLSTDTGHSWLVTLGQFSGTDPEDNTSHDEPDIRAADVDPGVEAGDTVEGRAADLNCWLWHRPTVEPLNRSGDQAVLNAFESTIASGIN
ncbi:MAG: maleylpyruvate isomerase N-terminal domain-containing protein [Nocardioidaceae bacterium]|nr:maleylpyruvate isomerase N-terminal domain-containing protein [Nocardioidaceae bacterium]